MWKKALEKFIVKYKEDKDVEAIILVGSYAVENNTKYSDIDVYIILNDQAKYQERGNKLIDGYLIEYFINPIYQVKKYMEEDKRGHGGPTANMLKNAKILYDKNKIIPELQKEAEYYINLPLQKDVMKYYHCWDAFNEYEAAEYHNNLQYYLCLKELIDTYLYNNDYGILPAEKIEKFLKNKEYRQKYNIKNFPNNEFNQLVINCFENECYQNLKMLYDYVMKNGKFDINNFVLRNKL